MFRTRLTVKSNYRLNSISRLVFIKETEYVFCEVENEILHISINFMLQWFTMK